MSPALSPRFIAFLRTNILSRVIIINKEMDDGENYLVHPLVIFQKTLLVRCLAALCRTLLTKPLMVINLYAKTVVDSGV